MRPSWSSVPGDPLTGYCSVISASHSRFFAIDLRDPVKVRVVLLFDALDAVMNCEKDSNCVHWWDAWTQT
ncbi:MAG: hypothetical protein M3364_06010 [Actinomycetota bacterium]|nr:hypothetical protein [Actinomycetota bacterium]